MKLKTGGLSSAMVETGGRESGGWRASESLAEPWDLALATPPRTWLDADGSIKEYWVAREVRHAPLPIVRCRVRDEERSEDRQRSIRSSPADCTATRRVVAGPAAPQDACCRTTGCMDCGCGLIMQQGCCS